MESRSERCAYMFRDGQRRLLFIRNFGSGVYSVAQLVHDVDSGENFIRKITLRRLRHMRLGDPNTDLKKPREIQTLETIHTTFKPPTPGLTCLVTECYGHEYILSKHTDGGGLPLYHSVSYWKLYNGQSVRTRWLSGDVLPPTAIVARMLRQVLSTLHYLYTAGEQPLYHGDAHLGNVWIHWTADSFLPDFYLGDFADASFADAPESPDLTAGEKVQLSRSIRDLHKFWSNLEGLLDLIGMRRGYGDPALKALRRLSHFMPDVINAWKTEPDTAAPPNLRYFIRWAQDLEEMFGEGGIGDETRTDAFIKYVTEERRAALAVERDGPLVVKGPLEAALRPTARVKDVEQPVSLPIHGPWQLVRAEGDEWVPAEAEGVFHHRPNRTDAGGEEDDDDLSKTKHHDSQPICWPAPYLEGSGSDESGRKQDDDLYSSGLSSPSGPAFSPPQQTEKQDEKLAETGKDDDELAEGEKDDEQFAWSKSAGDDAAFTATPINTNAQQEGGDRDDNADTRPTPTAQDDDNYDSDSDFDSDLDLEPDTPLFDWDLHHTKCQAASTRGAQARLQTIKPTPQPKPAGTANLWPWTGGLNTTLCTRRRKPPPAPAKDDDGTRERTMHTILHGPRCACPGKVWRADIKAVLRAERIRRGGCAATGQVVLGVGDPMGGVDGDEEDGCWMPRVPASWI